MQAACERRLQITVILALLLLVLPNLTPVSAAGFLLDGTTNLTTLCAELSASADTNNTITVAAGILTVGTFSCTTTKSVLFQGAADGTTRISFLFGFSLTTTGSVGFRGITLASPTQIQNAAQLVVANVRFDSVSGILNAAALKVTSVASAVISQSTFSSNTQLSGAPLVLASCGSVWVTDSTFYSNSAGGSGGVMATTVGSLTIEGSSFAFNTGGSGVNDGHVLKASDTNVAMVSCNLVSNGQLFSGDRNLAFVSGAGSLSLVSTLVSLNWGGTFALYQLTGASSVAGCTMELNFNSGATRAMLSVDSCSGGLTVDTSTISYNLGGGVGVMNTTASIQRSKVWGQGGYGVLCASQATVNAPTTSVYKNGWTFVSLVSPPDHIDAACNSGCLGLELFNTPNACANATDVVKGYNVSCPAGLNPCSQCSDQASCLDCNGLPFGTATPALCAKWNSMTSSGATVTYNGTSPNCLLSATDPSAGAAMHLRYDAIKVYYLNTTSNSEVALYSLPINDTSYTRSRGNTTNDEYCLNYERILDNGAGVLLQQCLFPSAQSVLFGNQTLTVPQDYTKITVSLSNMVSFDNQTSNTFGSEIDVQSRRVAVELSLVMSQAGDMARASSNLTYMEAQRFAGRTFSMGMELPNYAVFNTNGSNSFNYSLTPSSNNSAGAFKLVLEFQGNFDTVNYDPQFGLLVGSDGSGGGSDNILAEVLAPVLVGVALIVVVAVGVGVVVWALRQKHLTRQRFQPSSMVNFSIEEGQ